MKIDIRMKTLIDVATNDAIMQVPPGMKQAKQYIEQLRSSGLSNYFHHESYGSPEIPTYLHN